MKIDISESTLKTIIYSLENYLIKCLDIDEDAHEMVVVAKALGELQGAFKALKDNENREVRDTHTVYSYYELRNAKKNDESDTSIDELKDLFYKNFALLHSKRDYLASRQISFCVGLTLFNPV